MDSKRRSAVSCSSVQPPMLPRAAPPGSGSCAAANAPEGISFGCVGSRAALRPPAQMQRPSPQSWSFELDAGGERARQVGEMGQGSGSSGSGGRKCAETDMPVARPVSGSAIGVGIGNPLKPGLVARLDACHPRDASIKLSSAWEQRRDLLHTCIPSGLRRLGRWGAPHVAQDPTSPLEVIVAMPIAHAPPTSDRSLGKRRQPQR